MKDKVRKPDQGSVEYQGKCISASLEVVNEAQKRLAGHEILARRLYELIERQASAREISVRKIVVLPAWSNEYEERTGIVIEAEIEGSTDQRFSLWDTVCEQIGKLQKSLPAKESRFLSEDISFVVSRG
jgi:hypothetical protein